ncbi:interferon-induced GTP-binding protein Mx2 [Thozetella sp. PMI_491]|nr:interferon-induced GTP-binding protein Mx2 [Thozetella sp. PMI_491]
MLGNRLILAKIDKLRELNVASLVNLPQIVVVGDQSSGKSSALESLTGFPFPRDAGLCTRYVTQITCQRDTQKSISVSIIPAPGADAARQARLQKFYRVVTYEGETTILQVIAEIFEEANEAMGIRPIGKSETDAVDAITFSEDILKIEITGPNQTPLTILDVPGIISNSTPGLTTNKDIQIVRSMVERYIRNPQTIILAVIPCNVDIATQGILKLAEEADPTGSRTMGVLTKPDLATERVTKNAVVDLLLGKRHDLRLGYTVVKNRSGDDASSSLKDRDRDEKDELIMDLSKREFVNVKSEISQRLNKTRIELHNMGMARNDPTSQRRYLGALADKFNGIAGFALRADYTEDPIFAERPELRLITRMIELNEVFSNVFCKYGHTREFEDAQSQDNKSKKKIGATTLSFSVPLGEYSEISDIPGFMSEAFDCPEPYRESLTRHIERIFKEARGPELGTFGGTILGTTFKEQSQKWEALVLSHVSNAITIVHHFISELMTVVFAETQVREAFWDNILLEQLYASYQRALEHAGWLLEVEREGKPITYNHSFNTALQTSRGWRLQEAFGSLLSSPGKETESLLEALRNLSIDKSNPEQIRDDIHDILKSYYEVSQTRFVDIVCQQAVDHFLLSGRQSPLRVFSSKLIMELSDEQLETIAGEDSGTKRRRETLTSEIGRLDAALQVLRS